MNRNDEIFTQIKGDPMLIHYCSKMLNVSVVLRVRDQHALGSGSTWFCSRKDVMDLQGPSASLPFYSNFTITAGTGSNSVGKILMRYWTSSYKNRISDATLSLFH